MILINIWPKRPFGNLSVIEAYKLGYGNGLFLMREGLRTYLMADLQGSDGLNRPRTRTNCDTT